MTFSSISTNTRCPDLLLLHYDFPHLAIAHADYIQTPLEPTLLIAVSRVISYRGLWLHRVDTYRRGLNEAKGSRHRPMVTQCPAVCPHIVRLQFERLQTDVTTLHGVDKQDLVQRLALGVRIVGVVGANLRIQPLMAVFHPGILHLIAQPPWRSKRSSQASTV